MKKTLAIILCVVLIMALCTTAFAEGTAAEIPGNPIQATGQMFFTEVITAAVEIFSTVLKTAIAIFGMWILAKLGETAKTETLRKATDHVIDMALQTVDELQQTTVDKMKACNNGKLTSAEIEQLRNDLVDITLKKLSGPVVELLRAGKVDLNTLIIGAGDAYIKSKKENKEAEAAIAAGFTAE